MSHATTDRPKARPAEIVIPPHDRGGPPEPSGVGRRMSLIARLGRCLPNLLVLGLLAGVGVYGHRSGWKLPRFSALIGAAETQRDDWCEEHSVPESQCVECNPDLLPPAKDYGWCGEHGVPNCPFEHPELAQVKHAAELAPADRERAARALALTPRPENNPVCKNYRRRIQFASHQAVAKAGVDVAPVERQPIAESLSAHGEITYDQTRLASLSSRAAGTVWRVEKNVGDTVRAGEVLALVDSLDVGRAKSELLQALAQEELQRTTLARLDSLSRQGIVPSRQSQQAQAELVQARARVLAAQQSLVNLGMPIDVAQLRGLAEAEQVRRLRWLALPEAITEKLDPREALANLLPIRAPLDGVIVVRQLVAGEVVDTSRVLFQLADTSRMWLTLNVPLESANALALGQAVRFRPDGSRDVVSGKVVWISTTADQKTRMVAVRAELPNRDGQLRSQTFGSGQIILREEQEAIAVPNEAIHWEGCCHVVFVRHKGYFNGEQSPKVFHLRTVRLGARNERYTEILAGVVPGEVVAAKGSDVLRAELLKNNLGEGCVCGR